MSTNCKMKKCMKRKNRRNANILSIRFQVYITQLTLNWYDLKGHYPTLNRNCLQDRYPIKSIFAVTEQQYGGISSGNQPKLCFDRNCKVAGHKKNIVNPIP